MGRRGCALVVGAEKLDVLRQIGMAMHADGGVVPLLAFLAGRLDRVHFVSDLEGAPVAVQLAVSPRIWPRVPFRGTVDGVTITHPLAFIERCAVRDDDIYVQVTFGGGTPPEWYQNVVEEGVADRRHYVEAALDKVRQEIDTALDLYRTANEAMESAEGDELRYLQFALRKAEDDIRQLSSRLREMEVRFQRIRT